MSDYKGYNLFDKVIIVSKPVREWDIALRKYKTTNQYQGYVVYPNDKKMLESAMNWAKYEEHGPYNNETRKYEWRNVVEGEQHEFDNDGFTMTLYASATGSSQGGKLSFWNCKFEKDNKEFIIGINADMLIDVLMHCTFIKGVCQEKVLFARKNGNVGVLTKSMSQYQEALADMEKKANSKKGLTSKHQLGHNYTTLTCNDVYLYDVYQWYEMIDKEGHVTAIRRLDKPIHKYIFMPYEKDKNNISDYINPNKYFYVYNGNKLPKRQEGNIVINYDMTDEEVNKLINDKFNTIVYKQTYYYPGRLYSCYNPDFGLSTNKEIAPELSTETIEALSKYKVTITI